MNKFLFLSDLKKRLSGLPQTEIEDTLEYYSEIIDDRTDDGADEESVVASLGTPEEIAASLWQDVSFQKLVKEKMRARRSLTAWEIVLLILGAPLWMPLLIAFASILLTIYIVFWVVVVTFYIVDASVFLSGAAVLAAGIFFLFGLPPVGLFLIGCGLVLIGIALLLFPLCNLAARGTIKLCKIFFAGLKLILFGKGK